MGVTVSVSSVAATQERVRHGIRLNRDNRDEREGKGKNGFLHRGGADELANHPCHPALFILWGGVELNV